VKAVTLLQGDCLDLFPQVPDGAVDLVLCDLPYKTTNCHWDCEIDLDRLWVQYRRVLAPGGCIVLFGAMPFTAKLYASNPKWYKDHLIGDKNKCGSPGLANVRPMRVHEDILVFGPDEDEAEEEDARHEDVLIFAPGRTVYNPQMEVGEPYARKTNKPGGYVGRKNDHGYGMKPRSEFSNSGTRYPKSIIDMRRDFSAQQQVHSAQKPLHTITWLIETYSNPGATVIDNAMGSGVVGIACVKLGDRNFIGMEKVPSIFEEARERILRAVSENTKDNNRIDIFS
jgi:site-specific DNA-methyltransferase (adenine-specific)